MHCQAERPMMLQEWLGIMSCAGVVALHGGQDSIGQGRWANVRAWPHTHTVTGQPGWVRSRGATAAAKDATKAGSVGCARACGICSRLCRSLGRRLAFAWLRQALTRRACHACTCCWLLGAVAAAGTCCPPTMPPA